MTIERVTSLARQAAYVLPEPPAAHDAFGYLAWEELVVSTARRLAHLADIAPSTSSHPSRGDVRLDPATGALDAASLLALSALLADTGDVGACSAALVGAVRDREARTAGRQCGLRRSSRWGGRHHGAPTGLRSMAS